MVEIVLELDRADLIIGEDTGLRIEIRNTSPSPVTIPDPNRSPGWPKLTLVHAGTGESTVFGPVDETGDRGGHFLPSPPEADLSLQPGGSESMTATLLQRVPIPSAGSYRLEASIEIDGIIVTSPAVDLRIAPLDLRAIFIAGAHSGATPFQHILWSQADGGGSILVLTAVTLDHDYHPVVVESARLERLNSPVRPVLSVAPSGSPFPGMWIPWLDEPSGSGGTSPGPAGTAGAAPRSLRALYAMHGRVERSLQVEIPVSGSPVLIGPALHDFDREDASRPGPGDVAVWSDARGNPSVRILTLEPDGTSTTGPVFEVDGSRLAWGSAALLSDGERRAVVAVEDRQRVLIQLAGWKRGDKGSGRARVLFDWDGIPIASGATLNTEDEWLGATIASRPAAREPFWLYLWGIGRDGDVLSSDSIPFRLPAGPGHGRALVGRSPGGRPLALIEDAAGRWFAVDREGRCEPLPRELAGLGDPVLISWQNEAWPTVVFASGARGLTVRSFR